MTPKPCLLDTGPLVAFLLKTDPYHAKANAVFKSIRPPFLTTESVISEACFLMGKANRHAVSDIMALGRIGVYRIALQLAEEFEAIEKLFKTYSDQPISLADAGLIRLAGQYQTPHILTFDSDFRVYRWDRSKHFLIL